MVVVHVRLRSRPECRDETIDALRRMQRGTWANDAGCLRYQFAADLDDDCVFVCVEQWRDMAALRAHVTAPHMAEPDAVLDRTTVGRAQIQVFEAAETTLDAAE